MSKCKCCNNDLVWKGSLKDGRLECMNCNSNIPKFEHHVQGQNTANSDEWLNVYQHQFEED